MSEYKQCPNGHYYVGDKCPYCKGTTNDSGNIGSMKTEVYGNQDTPQPTETVSGDNNSNIKTTFVQGVGEAPKGSPSARPTVGERPAAPMSGRTVFGDDDEIYRAGNSGGAGGGYREARKLVGWLVSYTLDPMGMDFKLYEGRNIIGRDMDCSITVNDPMASSKHAVLLFRSGKYSITDSQSSHGTFVNDNDIELEPCYLQDGDVIRIGQTLFKFRTSF